MEQNINIPQRKSNKAEFFKKTNKIDKMSKQDDQAKESRHKLQMSKILKIFLKSQMILSNFMPINFKI